MADVGLSERTSIVSVGFYQALLPISLITSYWPNKNPSSFVVVFLGCIRRLSVRRSLTNVSALIPVCPEIKSVMKVRGVLVKD